MNKNQNSKSHGKYNTNESKRTKLDVSIVKKQIQDNKPTGITQPIKPQDGPTGFVPLIKPQDGPTGFVPLIKPQDGPTGIIQPLKPQDGPTGIIITAPINLNSHLGFVSQSITSIPAKVNLQNINNRKIFTIDEPTSEPTSEPKIEEPSNTIWKRMWNYFSK